MSGLFTFPRPGTLTPWWPERTIWKDRDPPYFDVTTLKSNITAPEQSVVFAHQTLAGLSDCFDDRRRLWLAIFHIVFEPAALFGPLTVLNKFAKCMALTRCALFARTVG